VKIIDSSSRCVGGARIFAVDAADHQHAIKDHTLYLSPLVAFNMKYDSAFWLDPRQKSEHVRVYVIRLGDFTNHGDITYATEAHLTRVKGPGSSGHESYARELKSVFKVPRLVKVSDLLVVVTKRMGA